MILIWTGIHFLKCSVIVQICTLVPHQFDIDMAEQHFLKVDKDPVRQQQESFEERFRGDLERVRKLFQPLR